MKKYLLLIPLFAFLFLGLGKFSLVEAGPQCNNKTSDVPGHTYTCEVSTPSSCNGLGQKCPTKEDCVGNAMCCICNAVPSCPQPVCYAPGTTPASVPPGCPPNEACTDGSSGSSQAQAGAPCSLPTNGKINLLGNCSCPTGTKRVDNECKSCEADGVCCGISLNTDVPFIGKCIEDGTSKPGPGETGVTGDQAFPVLMGSLTKILVTAILIISFVLIIIGGIMIATGNPSGGKKMIINVVVGIALLGASGVILRLINPNFFG